MAKRIKTEDKQSKSKVGCATMTIKNSRYVWTCQHSSQIIIEQKSLPLSTKDYEAKSEKRLKELTDAITKHLKHCTR